MGFGAIIIGDEIIRGKRQDKHFSTLVGLLAERGLTLDWSLCLGDNPARLQQAVATSMATDDVVFSFCGIGVTPDDHTRLAAARAAGVELAIHADAEREIRARFAPEEPSPDRLRLGEFPVGSRIIPNPYNRIPGFSFADHHFVPGFPQMAWPMVAWVLDSYYADRFHQVVESEQAILVWHGKEGALLDLMRGLEASYPGLTVFSLPSLGDETTEPNIELGARGAPDAVTAALAAMRAEVVRLGYEFSEWQAPTGKT